MGKLHEIRAHWGPAFRARPVRTAFAALKWLALVGLGGLAVAAIVYMVSGHGYETPVDATRRDRPSASAARYGRRAVFMTDEERRRFDDDDADPAEAEEAAEREARLVMASALPDPPGAEGVTVTGTRRRGIAEQFCLAGDAAAAAATMDRHYAALGWAIERHEVGRGRWVVRGTYAAGRFTATTGDDSMVLSLCSPSQTFVGFQVAPW